MTARQLIGLCDRILTGVLNRSITSLFGRSPEPILLGPFLVTNEPHYPRVSLKDLLNGIVFATPKRRTPIRTIWRKKYGNDNWNNGGTRLFKSKRNITTCAECGTFHEYHTICRTCFKRVQEESKEIIEKIRAAWGRGVIDKEVQVLYKGETTTTPAKRIVEIEKPRPFWFASNLSQKTARTTTDIRGPATESEDRTIKIKE